MLTIQLPKLKPWQKDVYDGVAHQGGSAKTFVLKSSRQKGKSVLCNVLLLTYLAENRCTCVVLEPSLAQSRRMFRQLDKWLDGSGIVESSNATLLEMTLVNGSEVLFKSAEQRDNLRGFTVSTNGILIIDEAAFIDTEIFEIIYPIVDACRAPMFIVSTPMFRSGEFFRLYTEGVSGKFPNVVSFDWTTYDTSEMLSKEKLEYYRQTMSPLRFLAEIQGEFISEGSFVFGDISKCFAPLSKKPPVYAGIDWSAGNDGDYTVLLLMDDEASVTNLFFWKDFDAVDLIDTIAQELDRFPSLTTCQVELNSLGKVYRDLLKRKVRKGLLRDFVTTNESKRRVIEQLITAFQQGQITIPQDKELVKQVQHYQIEKTPTGKITYNAINGVNDDAVIALALAYDLTKRKAGQSKNKFGYA